MIKINYNTYLKLFPTFQDNIDMMLAGWKITNLIIISIYTK